MAENKKSFILYCDTIHTVEKMPDDKAGLLFKHILRYVNDLHPKTDDLIVELTFEPIRQQLKRDLEKWSDTSVSRSENGRIGGLKSGEARRNKSKQNEANALNLKQNEHVSVSVSDNVAVNDNEKEKTNNNTCFSFDDFWFAYPNKTGKKVCESKYRQVKEHDREKIKNTINDFINNKPFKDYNYPNPSTYLNQERWNDEIKSKNKEPIKNGEFTRAKFICLEKIYTMPISAYKTNLEAYGEEKVKLIEYLP